MVLKQFNPVMNVFPDILKSKGTRSRNHLFHSRLIGKVDCVLLETNDGRLHLEQAMEVFKAGKICYIDKPIGATLEDAIAIYEMAENTIYQSSHPLPCGLLLKIKTTKQ